MYGGQVMKRAGGGMAYQLYGGSKKTFLMVINLSNLFMIKEMVNKRYER